ncbi:Polycystic kidney disease protein 1-like 3 [Actinoplanes sp. SE50]|uniref:hypothetical protein n=1 Tax=unclassified Actinoplanes TaxID=2626549 RepID=UPI00023ED607|nr:MULTISPECIES: hypothetical protein [unclassified Actinoplanes]AEV85011.1 Polycystic kidney disease protein 1-like 3 [Actinoplanes sp. SE50/110]ATO83402.1 Polycystic kidney disease protein 1-like 3 [Actinoplanes sp. SE50]SLM00809.1 polycystic kidney disease 1-like 3 [Actinoplanes sp. SE50/110]
MRHPAAHGEDHAPGGTRRVVRLLLLLGVAVAAYLVLTLFDHAARADTGVGDRPSGSLGAPAAVDPLTTVAGGVTRAVAHAPVPGAEVHRPTIAAPRRTVAAPRIRAAAPVVAAVHASAGATVRRVRAATKPVHHLVSETGRAVLPDTMVPARTAAVRQALPQLDEPVSPAGPAGPAASPGPGMPRSSSFSVRRTPILTTPGAGAPAPRRASPYAPAPSAPVPASPGQPGEHSASTGQIRDAGGGNAPAMAIVCSSWWPDVPATTPHRGTPLPARGRTVRHLGPPR